MTEVKYYKTLINGKSFHGGEFEYSLPKNGKPGKWHKHEGKLQMCVSGFHVTSKPVNWWHRDAKCYEVEYRGQVLTDKDSDKICVSEVRLIREVDPAEVQIFSSGHHVVTSGQCKAYGSASVTACDSASVTAYDSASVTAYDSASVTACDSASVKAYDSASVTAYGSASVTAYGFASVTACDSASVTACGSASVTAYGFASVTAYGSASVTAYGSASVIKTHCATGQVTLNDHAIEIDR